MTKLAGGKVNTFSHRPLGMCCLSEQQKLTDTPVTPAEVSVTGLRLLKYYIALGPPERPTLS